VSSYHAPLTDVTVSLVTVELQVWFVKVVPFTSK